jgi:hypothetical protein
MLKVHGIRHLEWRIRNRVRTTATLVLTILICCPSPILPQVSSHERIIVRGFDGNPLSIFSKAAYSPKRTCGACHPYDRITNGYHFQMGRTDGTGKRVIRDNFDPKFSWNLSAGMYGKH